MGLKENVIIGRLIPARLDLSEEGRNLWGIHTAASIAASGKSRAGKDGESAQLLEDLQLGAEGGIGVVEKEEEVVDGEADGESFVEELTEAEA